MELVALFWVSGAGLPMPVALELLELLLGFASLLLASNTELLLSAILGAPLALPSRAELGWFVSEGAKHSATTRMTVAHPVMTAAFLLSLKSIRILLLNILSFITILPPPYMNLNTARNSQAKNPIVALTKNLIV